MDNPSSFPGIVLGPLITAECGPKQRTKKGLITRKVIATICIRC